jgi:signal peptidase I
VGFVFLALDPIIAVLTWPYLLLALIPLLVGILLTVRRRVALGAAMIALAVVVPVVGGFLVSQLALKTYEIPSQAMEPTLQVEDRVLVNRTGIGGFQMGDMVVFHPPLGADAGAECGVPHSPQQACPRPTKGESSQTFIKRIVAGPGDTLSVREGHPVVNGVEKSDEPYTFPCGNGGACSLPKPIVVPPGEYFLLGDNRGASDDSRFWGPIPEDWIIGVAFARISPLGRISIF